MWASIITRILNIPESSLDTTVNTVQLTNGSIHHLSNNFFLAKLCISAMMIGPEILGFTSSEIGLHSLRSGAAMAMFLAGIPVPTIKLMGHWASKAFMDYIHPQVEQFSSIVSRAMILHTSFHTISNTNNSTHYHAKSTNPLQKHGLCQSIMIPNPITAYYHV
jgi:hypothetical protein